MTLGGLDGSGRDINEFIQMNQGKYSRDKIQAMLSHLVWEGSIYSTIDENHYASL